MPKYCKTCYKEKIDPLVKDEDLSYYEEAEKCDCCGEVKHLVKDANTSAAALNIAECKIETMIHIDNVRKFIKFMTDRLTQRGIDHDASKLVSPELEYFAQHTKSLASTSYDSEEYKQHLEALKPALDHHYSQNSHHPEHYPNGISDMTLIDIVEMICDWKASTLRTSDGNLLKSIERNTERFQIDDQLKQILINTAKLFEDLPR